MTRSDTIEQSAYRLGHATLGPVFVCFAHLLLRQARRTNCERLGFLARDGELLMRVVEHLPQLTGEDARPALTYLHLSRRSTTLAARPQLDVATLTEADAIRAGRSSWKLRLDYLGLTVARFAKVFQRLGLDLDAPLPAQEDAHALLADAEFLATVAQQRAEQRETLSSYLAQMAVGEEPPCLLVDIGWRGSILRNLERTFGGTPGFRTPAGAFFGLWAEQGALSALPPGTVGLISDQRRGRCVTEGAAWYAAFLLEAVCRADEGVVQGYALTTRGIEPLLAGDSPARTAESASRCVAKAVRQGILDYVATCGAELSWQTATDSELRCRAQRRLRRLAFLPTAEEIAVGTQLVHTESHDPDWAAPLIATTRAHPLRSPRHWLAGLSSPWRAGYIRSTGGPALAAGYWLAESALLALPATVRGRLTAVARTLASTTKS